MADREKMYRDSVRRVFVGETVLLGALFAAPFLFGLLSFWRTRTEVQAAMLGVFGAGIVIYLAGFCVSCDRYFRWQYRDGRKHKIVLLWSVFLAAAGLWMLFTKNFPRGFGGGVAAAFLLIFLGQAVMMARRKGWKILTAGLASGLCSLAGTAGIALWFASGFPGDDRFAVRLAAVILSGAAPLWLLAGCELRGRFLAAMAEIPFSRLRTPVVNGISLATLLLALAATLMTLLAELD